MTPLRLRAAVTIVLAVAAASICLAAAASSPTQMTEALTPENLLLAVDRLLTDRWYPPDIRATSARSSDFTTLQGALRSQDAGLRQLAVRSLGRFENPLDVPTLILFLNDTSSDVEVEAANAIAQALHNSHGDDVIDGARALAMYPNGATGDALASLNYDGRVPVNLAEKLAPKLLVKLVRANPDIQLDATVRRTLRKQAQIVGGGGSSKPDPDALEILLRIHDFDYSLIWYAAQYRCIDPSQPNCGWQMRYVVAQFADPSLHAEVVDYLRHDPAFQVRLIALRKLAEQIPDTKSCAPLLDALADSAEMSVVRIEVIGLLSPACEERDVIKKELTRMAGTTSFAGAGVWQEPARALEVLPRFNPTDAAAIVKGTLSSRIWQVRAAAVRAAAQLKSEDLILRFAEDPEAGVRTEVVRALVVVKSAQAADYAIRALDDPDYQLVRAAAEALKKTTAAAAAAQALTKTLRRITDEGKDTSRGVRLSIIERLVDLAGATPLASYCQGEYVPYVSDFDPMVSAAALKLIGAADPDNCHPPPDAGPTHRPPQQPSVTELRQLPQKATILLSTGDQLPLTLLSASAPLTVARFVALVKRHYYDGLTFHRVTPLLVAVGGSPHANDETGDDRFVRDEIGLERHTRGSVGLVTSGRDTGNMQFFIDLLDQPGFDREYTVFARVDSTQDPRRGRRGIPPIDALLEGAQIVHITLPLK